MTILEAALLGLVQGVTEFLPVSSSGHLAIFGAGKLSLMVLLHFGTLLSILVYYRRDVLKVLKGTWNLARAAGGAAFSRREFRAYLQTDPDARLALLIVVGSIPTGIIGLGLKPLAEYAAAPGHVKIVGACFVLTGVLMYFCDRFPLGGKGLGQGTFRDAITVGIFQGLAAMPGLSRSGLTVFAAVERGFERNDAARFSFLMAVPALVAANLLELREGAVNMAPGAATVGISMAFVAGYAALAGLVSALASQKLRYFTGYLVTLGLLVLLFS